RIGDSRSARLRATTSVPPPGPKGTTMRTGWLGKSAAPAGGTTINAAAASNVDSHFVIAASAGRGEIRRAPLTERRDALARRGGAGHGAEGLVADFQRGMERGCGGGLAH